MLATILLQVGLAILVICILLAIILRILPSKKTDKAKRISIGFDHKRFGSERFISVIAMAILTIGYVPMCFLVNIPLATVYVFVLILIMIAMLGFFDHFQWEAFIPMTFMAVGMALYYFCTNRNSGMGNYMAYLMIMVVPYLAFMLTRLNTRYCRWFKHHVDPSVYVAIKKYTDKEQRIALINKLLPAVLARSEKEEEARDYEKYGDDEEEEDENKENKVFDKPAHLSLKEVKEKNKQEEAQEAEAFLKDLPEPVRNKKMRIAVIIYGAVVVIISLIFVVLVFQKMNAGA